MAYRFGQYFQGLVLLAVMFTLPGLLQLPEYWSFVGVVGLWIVFMGWALYRAYYVGRGPFW